MYSEDYDNDTNTNYNKDSRYNSDDAVDTIMILTLVQLIVEFSFVDP